MYIILNSHTQKHKHTNTHITSIKTEYFIDNINFYLHDYRSTRPKLLTSINKTYSGKKKNSTIPQFSDDHLCK